MIVEANRKHKLSVGQVPTSFYTNKFVWLGILDNEKFGAIDVLRNLITMANNFVLKAAGQDEVDGKIEALVCAKLTNFDAVGFLHPLQVFTVLRLYAHGQRKTNKAKKWLINANVNAALASLLDYSFRSLTACNKNLSVANNTWKVSRARVKKNTALTPFQASILMCKSNLHGEQATLFYISSTLQELKLSESQTLQQAIDSAWKMNIGSAFHFDEPLKSALEKKEAYDAFIVYTNLETHGAENQLVTLFNEYKKKMDKPNCKFIFVSLIANQSHKSRIDANDPTMLELSGISTDMPRIINNFLRDLF